MLEETREDEIKGISSDAGLGKHKHCLFQFRRENGRK